MDEPKVKIEDEDIILKTLFDVLKKDGSWDFLKPGSKLPHFINGSDGDLTLAANNFKKSKKGN